jgi:hypothetical protein
MTGEWEEVRLGDLSEVITKGTIKANSTESRTLAILRDKLLPKLLNEELRISDELLHPRPTI